MTDILPHFMFLPILTFGYVSELYKANLTPNHWRRW